MFPYSILVTFPFKAPSVLLDHDFHLHKMNKSFIINVCTLETLITLVNFERTLFGTMEGLVTLVSRKSLKHRRKKIADSIKLFSCVLGATFTPARYFDLSSLIFVK